MPSTTTTTPLGSPGLPIVPGTGLTGDPLAGIPRSAIPPGALATFEQAAAIEDSINQKAAELDRLDAAHLTAVTALTAATAAQASDAAALATTRAQTAQLKRALSHAAVAAYTNGGSADSAADAWSALSPQGGSRSLVTATYQQVGTRSLSRLLAQAQLAEHAQARAAASESAAAAAAATAAAAAASAVADATTAEAALLAQEQGLQVGVSADIAAVAVLQGQAVSGAVADGTLALRPGVANPPAVLSSAATAIAFALAQVGKPYVWGGTGPDGYDCSGLMLQAWAAAGIALPRVAADQSAGTISIDSAQLAPGDLIFFDAPVGHVGMYLGNGLMVDAPHTGAVIRIESFFWPNLAGFGRVA